MFTAYFDASGKAHDPDIMFVSGLVGEVKKWLRFESRWDNLLTEFSIKAPFHTTDYIFCRRPGYEQFKNNDALRDAFEKKAVRIIRQAVRKPVSVGLLLGEFRQVQSEYYMPPSDPYMICGMWTVKLVNEWKRKRSDVDAMEFFYEAGDDSIGGFMTQCRQQYGFLPVSRPKGAHPQFQAADILAWRHARLVRDHVAQNVNRREAFAGLFHVLPHDACVVIGADELREACQKMGLRRKP